jgi:inorganic pyrophosphatase
MARENDMLRALALFVTLVQVSMPPATLPAAATEALNRGVAAARGHQQHLWRDTRPVNPDRTVNAYIEIPRGDRRKFEFDLARHERVIDRELSREIGGYPLNYGFVPQTISYDGDPFDAVMLGSALRGGVMVRGVIVGIMHMEDEKGLDSKVVLAPVDAYGRATQPIRADDQRRATDFFNRYKRDDPDAFSRVLGWGGIGEGRAFVDRTHTFFVECIKQSSGECRIGS